MCAQCIYHSRRMGHVMVMVPWCISDPTVLHIAVEEKMMRNVAQRFLSSGFLDFRDVTSGSLTPFDKDQQQHMRKGLIPRQTKTKPTHTQASLVDGSCGCLGLEVGWLSKLRWMQLKVQFFSIYSDKHLLRLS